MIICKLTVFIFRLSDESASVRLTAITVLTQLVLKDVMKVKGQVSEVAVLLLDPEAHIASLALNFFNELSAKVNVSFSLFLFQSIVKCWHDYNRS